MVKGTLAVMLIFLGQNLHATIDSFSNRIQVSVYAYDRIPYLFDELNTTTFNTTYQPSGERENAAYGVSATASALYRASNVTSDLFAEGSADFSGLSTGRDGAMANGNSSIFAYYYIVVDHPTTFSLSGSYTASSYGLLNYGLYETTDKRFQGNILVEELNFRGDSDSYSSTFTFVPGKFYRFQVGAGAYDSEHSGSASFFFRLTAVPEPNYYSLAIAITLGFVVIFRSYSWNYQRHKSRTSSETSPTRRCS